MSTAAVPLRVLVVDDHPVVADGVGVLLRSDPTIVVAGTARSGREAETLAGRLRPDVVLLDLRLPDMLGTEAIRSLRAVVPGVKVVLFTAYGDHLALPTAIEEEGAHGCLLKDSSITDLATALHRVSRGVTVLDPRLRSESTGKLRESLFRTGLTRREYEVLRRVALGRTNPEIAEELDLTRNTVKTYLQSVMNKLDARNRVEVIAKANQAQLL